MEEEKYFKKCICIFNYLLMEKFVLALITHLG